MKPVVIVGGGLAGLSAAVALCSRRIPVLLLEQKPALGGRTYSFRHRPTGDVVDNGQHLLIAGYEHTLSYLSAIGSRDLVDVQARPLLLFHHPQKGYRRFSAPLIPPPLNLAVAALTSTLFSFPDRMRLLRAGGALRRDGAGYLRTLTIREWLDRRGQSAEIRRSFWEPLAVSIMNETTERASALLFIECLRTAFFQSPRAASLAIPRLGLSEVFCDPAREYIESHGGAVRCAVEVKALEVNSGRVRSVTLRGGKRLLVAACIMAVPPASVAAIAPELFSREFAALLRDKAFISPIISVHLWFEKSFMEQPMLGLIGRTVQWLFNRRRITHSGRTDGYVTAVISAAGDLMALGNERIVEITVQDLRSVFGSAMDDPAKSLVIREKKATISLTPRAAALRPGTKTAIQNLFLAGDWTDTGYPATIEGAIVSGERAASHVVSSVSERGGGDA